MEKSEANSILDAIAKVDTTIREVKDLVQQHDEDIRDLKKTIHGSKPPKNGEDTGTPIAIMAKRGSAASFDVEELRGELLAVRTELQNQSIAMGIGQKGLQWLRSAEGRNTILRVATFVGVVYGAFRAAYSSIWP